MSGLVLSPDLDVDNGCIANKHIGSIPFIGGLSEILWRYYWKPYAKYVKHRSITSHAPVFSTLIRVVYLLWWLALIPSSVIYGAWVVGLMISDAAHIHNGCNKLRLTVKVNR